MSKCWGCRCSSFQICGGGPATSWCEQLPNGCDEGDLGDFNIASKSKDEMEKSTTKFYGKRDKEGNLVLEEAGFLANAGLSKGDVLLGVNGLLYNDPKQREEILTCAFTSPSLTIAFRYGSGKVEQSAVTANPAYSSPRD